MNIFKLNLADDVVCIRQDVTENMSTKRFIIKWLPWIVLKTSSADIKRMFRDLDKTRIETSVPKISLLIYQNLPQ